MEKRITVNIIKFFQLDCHLRPLRLRMRHLGFQSQFYETDFLHCRHVPVCVASTRWQTTQNIKPLQGRIRRYKTQKDKNTKKKKNHYTKHKRDARHLRINGKEHFCHHFTLIDFFFSGFLAGPKARAVLGKWSIQHCILGCDKQLLSLVVFRSN